jgi:hypothetical protein
MTSILLKGGIIRLLNTKTFYPIIKKHDITLRNSPVWIGATLTLNKNNTTFYRFAPDKHYEISIKNHDNLKTLLVNNMIIYQNENLFNYTIDISLNHNIHINAEYADFYKITEHEVDFLCHSNF